MESNERFLKNSIKNRMCYYFDNIIILEDFDPDNILKDEKSNNVLFYNFSCYFDEC